MTSKKKNLALAAISALPISHAAAAATTAGSPMPGAYQPAPPLSYDLQITDNQSLSTVTLNGKVITPVQDNYGNGVFLTETGPDGAPLYSLSNEPVTSGDIYFVNPATQAISAMVRFYSHTPMSSAGVFSVFSFAALEGAPDGSPFDATIYPAGISAAGGIPGMPAVDVGQSYVAPSGTPDPMTTGTYTFIAAPEPASASLVGIGAAILLKRRLAKK